MGSSFLHSDRLHHGNSVLSDQYKKYINYVFWGYILSRRKVTNSSCIDLDVINIDLFSK